MMDVNELIKKGEEYQEGFQKGREFAIDKYDKILIEIWDKLDEIDKKNDKRFISLFNTLVIFEKKIEALRNLKASSPGGKE